MIFKMVQVIVFFSFIPLYAMDDVLSPLPEKPVGALSPSLDLSDTETSTPEHTQRTPSSMPEIPANHSDRAANNLCNYFSLLLQSTDPAQKLQGVNDFLARHLERENYSQWRAQVTLFSGIFPQISGVFHQLPLGDLPLEIALDKNDRPLLAILLSGKAYRTLEGKIFRTNDPMALEILFTYGARMTERKSTGDTLLHAAMREGRNPQLVEYLRRRHRLTPLILNNEYQNPLHIWAARFEQEDSLLTEDAKNQFRNLVQGLEPIVFSALLNMISNKGKTPSPVVQRLWPLLAQTH